MIFSFLPLVTQTPATQAPRPPGPYDNIRLSKDVLPYHYDVELTIDLKNKNFSGKSSAFINVKKATDYLIIHIAQMKIKKAEVKNMKKILSKVISTLHPFSGMAGSSEGYVKGMCRYEKKLGSKFRVDTENETHNSLP